MLKDYEQKGQRLTNAAIVADRISKGYINRSGVTVRALRDVSVTAHGGEFTAVVGRSGSGKSTLLHCLSGLTRPDEGSIMLLDRDIIRCKESTVSELYCRNVGFVFQQYNLVESLTALENVLLPQRLMGKHVGRDELVEWFDVWGLSGLEDNNPSELSGGEQQRVALVRALAKRPDVLFADEPTGALDSRNARLVLDALSKSARQGVAVLMVTHDIGAASVADRVLVLRDGTITADLAHSNPEAILNALDCQRLGGVGR